MGTVFPSENALVSGVCALHGESSAPGLGQESNPERLNCDCAGKPTNLVELSSDESLSPPGRSEMMDLVLESSDTPSDQLLDSELPINCIQLKDCFDSMDSSKPCAGEFSLLLSVSGGMDDCIFESMEEDGEEGVSEQEGALESGRSASGSDTVREEHHSVLVEGESEGVDCCMETSESLSHDPAAGEFGSVIIIIS